LTSFWNADPPEKLIVRTEEVSESAIRINWRFPGERLDQLIITNDGQQVDGFVLTYAKLGNQLQSQEQASNINQIRHQSNVLPMPQKLMISSAEKAAVNNLSPSSAARIQTQSSGQQNGPSINGILFQSAQKYPDHWNGKEGNQWSAADHEQTLEQSQWQAIQLAPQQRSHVVKNLECGTWYGMKIWAFNKMGKGEPSDLITGSTRGKGELDILIFFF